MQAAKLALRGCKYGEEQPGARVQDKMTYNMPSPRIAATESFSLRSSRTCHNNGMGRRAVLD